MITIDPVIVIGLGGIGSHLVEPLARFMAARMSGVSLRLVDGDSYSRSNIARQRAAESRIGANKAEVQASILKHAFSSLKIDAVPEYASARNARDLVTDGSCVLSCVDNHATRKILSDAVLRLKNAVLISGGNEYVDGNVQVFVRTNGRDRTSPIDRHHPEIAYPQDDNPADLSCEELSLLPSSEQIIFTNLTAAALMLNAFYAIISDRIGYEEAFFEILTNKVNSISR